MLLDDNREDGSVLLTCGLPDQNIRWFKDGKEICSLNNSRSTCNLGSSSKDPRGIYWCEGSKENSKRLQVYYRSMYPLRCACVKVRSACCSSELLVFGECGIR